MPRSKPESGAVLLLLYCLWCLWLSLAQRLFEDCFKTNVSLPAVVCWRGQREEKKKKKKTVLMFLTPAPTWTSYFCTGVSVREEGIIVNTAAPGICMIHWAVQCQRVCRDQLPVSLGIQACHQYTGSKLPTCFMPGSGHGGNIWSISSGVNDVKIVACVTVFLHVKSCFQAHLL